MVAVAVAEASRSQRAIFRQNEVRAPKAKPTSLAATPAQAEGQNPICKTLEVGKPLTAPLVPKFVANEPLTACQFGFYFSGADYIIGSYE